MGAQDTCRVRTFVDLVYVHSATLKTTMLLTFFSPRRILAECAHSRISAASGMQRLLIRSLLFLSRSVCRSLLTLAHKSDQVGRHATKLSEAHGLQHVTKVRQI
jgi:hypothetical protein